MSYQPWHKRRRPVGVNAVPEVCVPARIVHSRSISKFTNNIGCGGWIGISMVTAQTCELRSRHGSIVQAGFWWHTRCASIPDTNDESRNLGRPKNQYQSSSLGTIDRIQTLEGTCRPELCSACRFSGRDQCLLYHELLQMTMACNRQQY